MGDVTRICCWSGPRNVSTALMYAFARRVDTRVVDEPLYAHYLRVSGAVHPGRDDVLAAQDADGVAVMRDVVRGPCDRPVLFAKQMAHHLVGTLDPQAPGPEGRAGTDGSAVARRSELFGGLSHVLLVRDPLEVLLSLDRIIDDPTAEQTGIPQQARMLDWMAVLPGPPRADGEAPVPHGPPAVLDARRLRDDPEGVLGRLCAALGLAFDPAMLSWPAGPIAEDGVWARHWYAGVHASTGWRPWTPPAEALPARLRPVADACRAPYERLLEHAL